MAAKKKPAPKRGASRYQAPASKPVPGWVWLGCGVVVGAFFMFLFSLEPGRDEIKGNKTQAPRTEPKKTPPPSEVKPKYDFYTLLPESEVIMPPVAEPAPTTVPAPKPVSAEEAAKIDTARALAALNGDIPPPAPVVKPAEPITVKPAETKPAATEALFIQAGSFRQLDGADRLRAQLLLNGQNARVISKDGQHRVLVGPFSNREQRANALRELSNNGFSNLLLQPR